MARCWWKASGTCSKHCAAGRRRSQRKRRRSPLPHPLLALLRAAPYTSEGLAAASGMTLPDVLATLSELELDGRVACEAGTWVHRSG